MLAFNKCMGAYFGRRTLALECPPSQFMCLTYTEDHEETILSWIARSGRRGDGKVYGAGASGDRVFCIPDWQVCDSIPDCPNGSDEFNCGTN